MDMPVTLPKFTAADADALAEVVAQAVTAALAMPMVCVFDAADGVFTLRAVEDDERVIN